MLRSYGFDLDVIMEFYRTFVRVEESESQQLIRQRKLIHRKSGTLQDGVTFVISGKIINSFSWNVD